MIVKLGSLISEYSVRNKADENIPVYSVTNEQGFCTGYFSKEVASQDRTTYKIVPRGCFAYNPSRINVGSVDVQECEDRVIVSPLYVVFSVDEKLNRRYLLHYLKSDITLTYIKAYASGSVRDNLKFSILKDFPINLPSAEEQGQIVATLDGIEHLIALRKEEIASLDELVKSRFVELFGGLERTTTIARYISELRGGKSLAGTEPCKNKVLKTGAATFGWFDPEQYKYLPVDYEPLPEHKVETGDVIISRMNTPELVGACSYVFEAPEDMYYPDRLWKAVLKEDTNPIFLWQLLWDRDIRKAIKESSGGTSGTMHNISKPNLLAIKCIDAPIELQNEYAAFVEQTDKSKYFACQTLSFLLKLANNLQSWREKQYDY